MLRMDWGELSGHSPGGEARTDSSQSRRSTVETGESRWREGRQVIETVTEQMAMNEPAGSVIKAMPGGEADPLGFVKRAVWTERMLACLLQGGPQGGKWYSLHDKVFSDQALREGYRQVALNRGSPGVDRVTVAQFGARLDTEIVRVQESWRAGTFQPQAIRRQWIDKPGSQEQRPLGIPTVRDRMVQAALRVVLEPIFEMDFHPCSYGFRPNRGAKEALQAVSQSLQRGQLWVVDADLKGYFDSIPHGPLLRAVERRVTDRRLLHVLRQYLQAGIMEDGEVHEPTSGTPQGGVISPLLANIYLNEMDWLLAGEGHTMIRYADDFVVLCPTQESAEAALATLQRWTQAAGLTLHPAKTRLVNMHDDGSHFDFLGFRFKQHVNRRTGQPSILRLVRPKSEKKIYDRIRELTPRNRGVSLRRLIGELNPVLQGWFNYYRSTVANIMEELDKFVRRRLRAILARHKGWGGVGRTFRCHDTWTNEFFEDLGLLTLLKAHRAYRQSCRGTR